MSLSSATLPVSQGTATTTSEDVRPTAMARARALAGIAVQLTALLLVIRQFQIESTAFFHLTTLAFGGFLVHHFLPLRYRLPFFVALSFAGIGLVLGIRAGLWLIGVGTILIGLCHLPLPFRARLVILLLTAGGLAAMRLDWVGSPWSGVIWPILGSMFMFRLCVYLYDLKHDRAPRRLSETFSYFFLLPNVCFPLFPVVDFKTFRRNYYNDEEWRIYQSGAVWMTRGVVQLIVYRFVYHHLTIPSAEVASASDLAQHLVANFLLYLRVSGQFHVIVGMLHLFGFNLPPTHYLYFLASSFNDFWRRINIYWKDFMMKLVYYPCFFQLRRLGQTQALVISTLVVFGLTWLLHSYQWFWLRGTFPLTWQDGMFWGVLGLCVVANSLYEAKYGRQRALERRQWTVRQLAIRSAQTVATFVFICILWSLWTSESLGEWARLWSVAATDLRAGMLWLPALLLAGVIMSSATGSENEPRDRKAGWRRFGFRPRPGLMSCLILIGVYAIGQPVVYSHLGRRTADVIESLQSVSLNAHDTSRLETGYYESLIRVDRFNSQLWEVYMRNPVEVNEFGESGRTVRWTDDFRRKALRPDFRGALRRHTFSTNRWGMRDAHYDQTPPPGTLRVALMGSSAVMGSGVSDGENFESLIERRLNEELTPAVHERYEILNFSVGGYGPLEMVATLEEHALAFEPDLVMFVSHDLDARRAVSHLAKVVVRGLPVPYPELREIVSHAGVSAEMSEAEAQRRLDSYGDEILRWTYHRVASLAKATGSPAIWVFLPILRETGNENAPLVRLARDAGLIILDLSRVYDGRDMRRLRVSERDNHPNADGHQVLADALYEHLRELDPVHSLGIFARGGRGLAP